MDFTGRDSLFVIDFRKWRLRPEGEREVTESGERRRQDMERLLRLMVDAVGDDSVNTTRFPVRKPEFAGLLPTTWPELEAAGLIRPDHAHGNPTYLLTPRGWLEALRLTGELQENTATWSRAQKLVRELKDLVRGRDQYHDALEDPRHFGPDLPPGWVWNAVTSGLLRELFGPGMNAYPDPRSRFTIRVPPTFGMEPLDD